MTKQERNNYCKDCDRSIWGDRSCDININDNGYYNRPDTCLCKIVNGKRAEPYSWEKENQPTIKDNKYDCSKCDKGHSGNYSYCPNCGEYKEGENK